MHGHAPPPCTISNGLKNGQAVRKWQGTQIAEKKKLALAQGDDDPTIGLLFDQHALYCARRRGIGGSTRLVAQHHPWAPTSSGPGMLTWASASLCQCHRRAVAVSTGAVDLDAVRPAIDAAGRGLKLTSFSACEETLVPSEKPRFGGELHALHGRPHAAQLVLEHFERHIGHVGLSNEDRASRNSSNDAMRIFGITWVSIGVCCSHFIRVQGRMNVPASRHRATSLPRVCVCSCRCFGG